MTDAVFIGSSNAVAGTWPEIICSQHGWNPQIFSISGGGFTQSGPSRFINQLNAAIAGTTAANVSHVFIVDAGNDIRATNPVRSEAAEVFAAAESAYPGARIIVLPCLWGMAADNEIAARMVSVTDRFAELRDAALGTSVEIIPSSWLWHWDDPSWMRPKTATESGVHYTPAGYQRVARFVHRYLIGQATDYPIGWTYMSGVNSAYVDPSTAWLRTRREDDGASVQGRFTISAQAPADGHIGWIPRGTAPLENVRVPIISDTRQSGWLDVFPTGQVRAFTALPTGTWTACSDWPVF